MRPTQWSKSLVIFAALIFSRHLLDPDYVARVVAAFVCFCLVSSGAYVMNDVRDRERDRLHPLKARRPIPAGRVSPGSAVALSVLLILTGLSGALLLGGAFAALTLLYLALQAAYTFVLKDMVILDVMAIAAGFVIRAVAGAVVISVPFSTWLIICTFLLALFLALAKRRHELVLLDTNATNHRASLAEYSPYFLDQMIAVVTPSTVVAYAIYTVSPEVQQKLGTSNLYLTFPFVVFGIFRYLYLVHQREQGGNPTQVLLNDRPMQAAILLWLLTVVVLLYVG